MTNDGTIDISNLVDNMRETFIKWACEFIFAAAIATPGLGWFALPIISDVVKGAIHWGVSLIANSAYMQVFFLNTSLRKTSQAFDFIDAVAAKNALPPTATEDEYKRAEQNQMESFRRFVCVSN